MANLQEYAFGTNPTVATSGAISYDSGVSVTPGLAEARNMLDGEVLGGVDYRAIFGRRKDYVAAGLTYTVEFSAGLDAWVPSAETPTLLSGVTSGSIDAVSVPYPFFIITVNGVEKPTFFRITVTLSP